jgi:hypothetical protein
MRWNWWWALTSVALAAGLPGCGGTVTPPAPRETPAAQLAAREVATGVTAAFVQPETATPEQEVAALTSGFQKQAEALEEAAVGVAAASREPAGPVCPFGGGFAFASTTSGAVTVVTWTFRGCVQAVPGRPHLTRTVDGQKTVEYGLGYVLLTWEHFAVTWRRVDAPTTVVRRRIHDGTLRIAGQRTVTRCGLGGRAVAREGSFEESGTDEYYVDGDGDGRPERHVVLTRERLTTTFAFAYGAPEGCAIAEARLVLDGRATRDDRLDDERDASVGYDALTIEARAATRGGVPGLEVTITGGLVVDNGCVEAAVEVATAEPLFVPTTDGRRWACPSGGTLLVTGDAGTTAVEFTPSGGVRVDVGDDGTVDAEYESCRELRSCR